MEEKQQKLYTVIHSEKDIRERVRDIAEQVLEFVKPNDVFLCLLRGGIFFYSDLMRQLCCLGVDGLKLHFLDVKTSNNNVGQPVAEVLDYIFEGNVMGQIQDGANVWIVDEIMDSGRSVSAVISWLDDACCRSNIKSPEYNTVMMIERVGANHDKRVTHEVVGFVEDRKEWFVGYGMDGSDGVLRSMPMIAFEHPDKPDDEDC